MLPEAVQKTGNRKGNSGFQRGAGVCWEEKIGKGNPAKESIFVKPEAKIITEDLERVLARHLEAG
jgi:hypothetical protein